MSRWVLGLNLHHDASACLSRDGIPVVALAQERLARRKHARVVTDELVDYCLDAAGIGPRDLDLVVLTSLWLPAMLADEPDLLWRWYEGVVHREVGQSFRLAAVKPPVRVLSHHLAHAFSVFGSSGWDEGAVLIVDWAGSCRMDLCHPEEEAFVDTAQRGTERERVSLYHFERDRFRVVDKQFSFGVEDLTDYRLPLMLSSGIGGMYEVVGQFLFGNVFMAGKVMGLAPFGTADDRLLAENNGGFLQPRLDVIRSMVGHRVPPADPIAYADLAATAQATLEHHVFELVDQLHRSTGTSRLAYGGCVALNCVLNSRLEKEGPFQELFVVPASNDTGTALGAALYGDQILGPGSRYRHRSDYLGREYTAAEMETALVAEDPLLTWETLEDEDLVDRTAHLLADGKVVGWFQGRSELGPRALGNRSILADARDPAMKDTLNKKVKHREAFRPFGPLVLHDRAADVFDVDRERPFMLYAEHVREEWRSIIPSAVHVDGTARIQTVDPSSNPRLFALLSAFDRITSVPVLINTSLNIRGEPIVERPSEAIDILRQGKLDALVLGNRIATAAPLRLQDPEIRTRIPKWRAGCRLSTRSEARHGALHVGSKVVSVPGRPGSAYNVNSDSGLEVLVDGRSSIAEILDSCLERSPELESQLLDYLRLGFLSLAIPATRATA